MSNHFATLDAHSTRETPTTSWFSNTPTSSRNRFCFAPSCIMIGVVLRPKKSLSGGKTSVDLFAAGFVSVLYSLKGTSFAGACGQPAVRMVTSSLTRVNPSPKGRMALRSQCAFAFPLCLACQKANQYPRRASSRSPPTFRL